MCGKFPLYGVGILALLEIVFDRDSVGYVMVCGSNMMAIVDSDVALDGRRSE